MIGFLAHAHRYGAAFAQAQVLAPAKSLDDMQRIIVNDRVDAGLALLFMSVVVAVLLLGLVAAQRAWRAMHPTAAETPRVAAQVRS